MFKKNPKLKAIKVHLVIGVERAEVARMGPLGMTRHLALTPLGQTWKTNSSWYFLATLPYQKCLLKKNYNSQTKIFFFLLHLLGSSVIKWVLSRCRSLSGGDFSQPPGEPA